VAYGTGSSEKKKQKGGGIGRFSVATKAEQKKEKTPHKTLPDRKKIQLASLVK
jgi:hypothetical protein